MTRLPEGPGVEAPAPSPDLSTLWRPVRVGAVTVPNRIVVSAHNTAHGDEQLASYLAARAAGGPGLIVMGGVPVHPTTMTNPKLIPAWERSAVGRLAAIATAVHAAASSAPTAERAGAGLLFGQIFHAGPNDPGNSVLEHQHAAIAPSAIAAPPTGRIPKVADQREIDAIVAGFAATARNLMLAGFDGVEISGSHGYLVHAFLSPTTNHRTDRYGGSEENRVRLALDIGRAIRESCGPDFPVMMRLSLDERLGPDGMTPASARGVLALMDRSGLFDAFSVSGGVYATLDETVAPASAQRRAVFRDSARVAREVVRAGVPVMLTGSIMDLELAAEIVEAGDADLIGMARAQIADPELVHKGLTGRLGEVRHCIGSNQGCWRGIKARTGVTCTVNPMAGREHLWGSTPSPVPARRVLVVGGGPAGLKAAVTAAERGHVVTVVERSAGLGGQLRSAAALPGRASWHRAVDDLVATLDRLGVEVRLGVEADEDLVREARADAVIVATGAVWQTDGWSYAAVPRPAPGISPGTRVLGPVEAIASPELLGDRVVVIDDTGGYAPLGVAELLADRGASVELVTPRPALGDQTVLTGEASFVIPRLLQKGVRMATRLLVDAIADGQVRVAGAGMAPRVIEATGVVTCLHRVPRDGLFHRLQDEAAGAPRSLHLIGDARAPRELDDALIEAMAAVHAL